jgi:hypothetical protein
MYTKKLVNKVCLLVSLDMFVFLRIMESLKKYDSSDLQFYFMTKVNVKNIITQVIETLFNLSNPSYLS